LIWEEKMICRFLRLLAKLAKATIIPHSSLKAAMPAGGGGGEVPEVE
jgi:hypothetical protein